MCATNKTFAVQCDSDSVFVVSVVPIPFALYFLLSVPVVAAACVWNDSSHCLSAHERWENLCGGLHYANNKLRNAFENSTTTNIFHSIFVFRVRHAALGHLYAIFQLLMWSTMVMQRHRVHPIRSTSTHLSWVRLFFLLCRWRWRKSRSN